MSKRLPKTEASGADPYAALTEGVLHKVLAGELAPGERLTERYIVETLRCTHAAAREVLHRLQALGAVVVSQRRGARVVSAREAPPGEVELVWRQLLPLLEAAAGGVFSAPARGAPAERRVATVQALKRLGTLSGEHRLAQLLQQIALQRAIVSGRS